METWHLKSPYFSSDTDSSPSFQVQSQGYTYTTCAECILDVAQKTARLQVWLWFCVTHGHSEFGQFAHFARQGIKHQRHQVLLLRDTPTCGAALTSTMFHQSGALLTKLVSEQICLAFLGPDFKIAKLAATLLQRGAIEAASKRAAKKPWRLARNACFGAPTCLVWSLRFPCGFAVSMGKLQNISFSDVSNCENWRNSHEMLVLCAHVSRLESQVFRWPRRVYGGSCKSFPLQRFSSRLSCRFAWQAWRFVTFQPV